MSSEICNNFFEKVFSLFQDTIAGGVPSLHIPPFDPLRLSGIKEFKIQESFFVSDEASFDDVVVSGLSSFSFPKPFFELSEFTLRATTTSKRVQGKGCYVLKGKAKEVLALSGTGQFAVNMDSISAVISLKFTEKDVCVIRLDPKVSVNIFVSNETKIKFEDIDVGVIPANAVEKIEKHFTETITEYLHTAIAVEMENHLQKLVDQKFLEERSFILSAL